MEHSYLIRYGLMGEVGRFTADTDVAFERSRTVVIRSHRGTELGVVLAPVPERSTAEVPAAGTARILRAAGPDDLAAARDVSRERDRRFDACRQVFAGAIWPIELIDVEPLLDSRRTVLHYLGPHRLDVAGILAVFRAETDLDVMLQPVGRDIPDDEPAVNNDHDDDHGCGSCTSGGGGGCGTTAGGCGDCGVKKLMSRRN